MDIKCYLHNKWDMVVRDAKTNEIIQEVTSYNIILNQFWDMFISQTSSATLLSYIHFGSGTDAPVPTNTKLTTPIGSKLAGNTVQNDDGWIWDGIRIIQKSCRLEANEHNGYSISEVGFANSATTSGNLRTHSLLKDQNGNPLSILKTDTVVIDIYGTFYVNQKGLVFNNGKGGMRNDAWGMIADTASYFGYMADAPLGFIHGVQQTQIHSTGDSSIIFDVPNKKVTYPLPDIPVGSGNLLGGIKSMSINGNIFMNLPCDGFAQPVITKEVVGTGDGATKDFQTAFGWLADNGTAKAYVNDIEVPATFGFDLPYPQNSIYKFMRCIPPSTKWPSAGARWQSYTTYLENPHYQDVPITHICSSYSDVYASDDLENWDIVANNTQNQSSLTAINSSFYNKRYWKIAHSGKEFSWFTDMGSSAHNVAKNVHLNSAPALGDVVTVTYQPNCIAKDDKHILKGLSLSIQFAEYAPV